MSDDALLKRLGQIARENEQAEEHLEEHLLALARGESGEKQFLESLEGHDEIDADAAALVFAPFDKKFEDLAVHRIEAELKKNAATSTSTSPSFQQPPDEVAHINRHRSRRWIKVASPIIGLAAAALLVFALLPKKPIPEYSLSIIGGEKAVRGEHQPETETPLALSPGGAVEIILKPERATEQDVHARVFLVHQKEIARLNAPIEKDEQGAIRIVVVAGEHFTPLPGRSQLVITVGPSGELPGARAILAGDAAEDVTIFQRQIEFTP